MKYSNILFILVTLFFVEAWFNQACGMTKGQANYIPLATTKAPLYDIEIINSFPHDSESFTEGLVYYQGHLYESTGLNGKSVLKKLEIESGKVVNKFVLAEQYFGEGMAILNGKIYQLTWKSKVVFIYDLNDLTPQGKFNYETEGWGLTTDGKYLYQSDGTATIYCRDAQTFSIIRKIEARDGKNKIANLNELEYIEGEIWANIFLEDIIVRISPQTGKVLGWIDLSSLQAALPAGGRRDVLNGIAYDPAGDRIFITGKFWPKLFEIKIKKRR